MFITSGYSAQTRRVRSGTEHHHVRADVLVGLRDASPGQDAQAGRAGLLLERRRLHAVQADDVALGRTATLTVDRLADPLERHAPALVAHGDGPAEVDDPVDVGDVG